MSLTLIETLENAEYNLTRDYPDPVNVRMARSQVANVRTLLEKGYDAYDDLDRLLAKYGDAESVPEKEGRE